MKTVKCNSANEIIIKNSRFITLLFASKSIVFDFLPFGAVKKSIFKDAKAIM